MEYISNNETILVRLENYCSISLDTIYKYSCNIPSNDQAVPFRYYNKTFQEILL